MGIVQMQGYKYFEITNRDTPVPIIVLHKFETSLRLLL
jgi:hypothetical protein